MTFSDRRRSNNFNFNLPEEDEQPVAEDHTIEAMIESVVNPTKSLMTFEKRVFLSRCQSKHSQNATKAYLEGNYIHNDKEMNTFRRDRIEGVMKQ